MNIDPITLPPFPLGGLAMEPHMAAIQAWGMACAKVGAVAALDKAVIMAHEWAAARKPNSGGYALRNYSEDVVRLRDQLGGKTNEGSGG